MNKMISISKVRKLTGVTIKTLKIWDNEGKLKSAYKTADGHRRYRLGDIETVEGNKKMEPNEEMVQDLISVVTCFSARLYGTHEGRKLKKAIKELEKRRGESCENNNQSDIS